MKNKIINKVLWTLALSLFSVGKPLFAQALDSTGRCPADIQFAADGDTDFFAIVSSPELFVGADDDRLLKPEVSAAISMHTGLKKIRETEFRLLIRSKRKLYNNDFVCGWVNKLDVLSEDAPPVKVGNYLDVVDKETGKTQSVENPLPLKAILRSNPDFESGDNDSDAKLVTIYEKPTLTSDRRTNASVFGIYLIYQERFISAKDHWYWIAGDPPGLATKFSGWVPAQHVLLWESQISLYFNEQVINSDIFVSRDSAATSNQERVLARRPIALKERTIGPPDAKAKPATNIARFPILLEESSTPDGDKTIYRIGFFGDSQAVQVSSERSLLQKSVRKIDILFVLDNTLSMTEYFPYVVQAVRNSTDRIADINKKNGYDVEVKYAAAIYGDYRNNAATLDEVQFQVLARLGSPGYAEHLGRLTAIAGDGDFFDDALDDKPEAGYAGIVLGINELEWTEKTAFKVVVWIGDHGNRSIGDRENLGAKEVKQIMQDNNVLLLPINVSGRYHQKWNNAFIDQGNDLAGLRGLSTKIAHSGAQSNDYESAASYIEESIANMYVSSLTASAAIREGTNVAQTLKDRRDLLELDIPAAEADVQKISTAICEMAFGSVGCERVNQNGQFMAEGFVRYEESLKNYDFWVNLEFLQLDVLSRIMETTCRAFERSTVKRSLEQAMLLVTTTMGGDSYRSDIPIGVFLRRKLFIPHSHFPSFLESTPDKIEEQWQIARDADTRSGELIETRKIADPICRSATLLRLAFDNKRLIDVETDLVRSSSLTDQAGKEYSWSVVSNDRLVDFNWEWAQGGENNYFYIPVNFLPSNVDL